MSRFIVFSFLCLLYILSIAVPRFIVFNYSTSLPRGIYIRSFSEPRVGSAVVFNYMGFMLIKYIAALPGDYVHIDADGYRVNNNYIGAIINGKKHVVVNEIVADDSVYVFSPHARSLDSRYFGAVQLSAVRNFFLLYSLEE